MKKILLLISAVICTIGAFAQEAADAPIVSDVLFNVEGQTPATDDEGIEIPNSYNVPSENALVNITLVDLNSKLANEWKPMVMYVSGNGFGVDPGYAPVEGSGESYTLGITEEMWGNPYMGRFYVTVMLFFANDEMDIYTVDDEPLFFQVVYSTENKTV